MSDKPKFVKHHHRIEAMGLLNVMNPFALFNSSSRLQMMASHTGQACPPLHSDVKHILTGYEAELGKHVFNIKMPEDGILISRHKKWRNTDHRKEAKYNPLTTLIYQGENGEYDCIDVYSFRTQHLTFGYPLDVNPIVDTAPIGSFIPAGTVLAETRNIHEGNIYSTSVEANLLVTSELATTEDGYVISESFAKRCALLEMGDVTVEVGKSGFLLNLYGDENNYKPLPDIGERIRPDGLVVAIRPFDKLTDAMLMNPEMMRHVDMIHDRRYYVTGSQTMEVYDIIVDDSAGENRNKRLTPEGTEGQLEKYAKYADAYYQSILDTYNRSLRNVQLSPRLQQLITRAMAQIPNEYRGKGTQGLISRTYKNDKLDEYRIQILYQGRKQLENGAKISDYQGTLTI